MSVAVVDFGMRGGRQGGCGHDAGAALQGQADRFNALALGFLQD